MAQTKWEVPCELMGAIQRNLRDLRSDMNYGMCDVRSTRDYILGNGKV